MNRRELLKSRKVLLNHTFFVYIVCAVLFLCGCVVGIIYSHSIDEGSSIFSLIEGYLGGILENEIFSEDLLGLIFEISGPALISFILGFSILGVPLIPLLSLFRGFSLSFATSLLMSSIDKSGAVFTIILIAIRALISIPSFFMVSVQSVDASLRLFLSAVSVEQFNRGPIYNRRYFLTFAVIFFILILFAVVEKFLLIRLFTAFI